MLFNELNIISESITFNSCNKAKLYYFLIKKKKDYQIKILKFKKKKKERKKSLKFITSEAYPENLSKIWLHESSLKIHTLKLTPQVLQTT